MTDYPRFERVKGPPDVAHRRYHGGPIVDLLLSIIDGWSGRPRAGLTAPTLDPASGAIELHERPPTRRASGTEEIAHRQASERLSPDERFSHDFLVNSGRTKSLQVGIFVSFVAVLVVIIGMEFLQRPTGQAMQSTVSLPSTVKHHGP